MFEFQDISSFTLNIYNKRLVHNDYFLSFHKKVQGTRRYRRYLKRFTSNHAQPIQALPLRIPYTNKFGLGKDFFYLV